MRFAMLLFTFWMFGCQAMIYGTASDLNKLKLGMDKGAVIKIMGEPVSTSADASSGREVLIYKRMKHAISEWPRTYEVTLKAGKVIRWGEQYQEQNVNNY